MTISARNLHNANMAPVERRIAARLVTFVLAQGHTISVNDGEAFPVKRSSDPAAIFAAMASTDSDWLLIRRADGTFLGQVYLVWGNEDDLISDSSDNEATTALLAAAGF